MLTMAGGPDRSSENRRSPRLLAARKFALMASVVAGLGAATYGLTPTFQAGNIFAPPVLPTSSSA
jgi:serine protease Do